MAIYKLFPEKDATLYTLYPKMNTGLDEILEASTYLFDSKAQTSRYLIKFSQNEINNAYDSYISGSGVSYLSTINNALSYSFDTTNDTYTDNTYNNLSLTSSLGTGKGGEVNVQVSSNSITNLTVINREKIIK